MSKADVIEGVLIWNSSGIYATPRELFGVGIQDGVWFTDDTNVAVKFADMDYRGAKRERRKAHPRGGTHPQRAPCGLHCTTAALPLRSASFGEWRGGRSPPQNERTEWSQTFPQN
jgi:hypothetical protein